MKGADIFDPTGIIRSSASSGMLGMIPNEIMKSQDQKKEKEEEERKKMAAMGVKPMKKGGAVKKMAKGGSASSRADGCVQRGKTKGRFV
jgi:hypothetical protein